MRPRDNGATMCERLITIATFRNVTKAHLARMKLDMEEIECFLQDEYIVAIHSLYDNLVGGVKLQVRESDVPRAREILQLHIPAPAPEEELACPKCGSTDINTDKFSRRLVFLSILLLGIPLPFIRRNRRCRACGHRWK